MIDVICIIHYFLCLNVTVVLSSWSRVTCKSDFSLNMTEKILDLRLFVIQPCFFSKCRVSLSVSFNQVYFFFRLRGGLQWLCWTCSMISEMVPGCWTCWRWCAARGWWVCSLNLCMYISLAFPALVCYLLYDHVENCIVNRNKILVFLLVVCLCYWRLQVFVREYDLVLF